MITVACTNTAFTTSKGGFKVKCQCMFYTFEHRNNTVIKYFFDQFQRQKGIMQNTFGFFFQCLDFKCQMKEGRSLAQVKL
jgi:hypothetical protein